jgi:hypothetical protein
VINSVENVFFCSRRLKKGSWGARTATS